MQQFEHGGSSVNEVRLTEEEARALAELHAQRREVQSQPTLAGMAAQLGISETEARVMLTEIRSHNSSPPVSAPVFTAPSHERSISSSMWALIALAAAVIIVSVGIFTFRNMGSSAPPPDEMVFDTAFPSSSTMPAPPPVIVHPPDQIIIEQRINRAMDRASKAAERAAAAAEKQAMEQEARSAGR